MVKKYPCPCCGFYTYKVPASENCGFICPVCFWENYSVFGSCRKDMTEYVRPPKKEEFG
ncbi:MAG: hypothetical protein HFH66_18150 [Lachnospiraceae bacterium]|uniref:CPCC family cysteine-rich protein n=1 Tax=uncultured Clostridium sp. TaxID=59620 RepID=UPI00272C7714|nr:CPCC family cysteine-rich protein [uncultured Clostridium sp.]MCI8753221.1 hypothetical protein [Lachnospiraceae bacterium]